MSDNNEKLKQAVAEGLQIAPEKVTDDLTYESIREWDSVAHMALVAAIEERFDLMLDTDDIIAMSSVGTIKQILGKYDVAF
ncbi:MAG TPA: acyl carrier protein [Caulobacteraceae bacterium]|nr:acyl carrier protein [Caulobacteraceae bacterium]